MTVSLSAPISLPISALLAPQPGRTPSSPLPSPSAAILGPLPPTSPIHLALNWIAVNDLPEYQPPIRTASCTSSTDPGPQDPQDDATLNQDDEAGPRRGRGRALIITGNKFEYHQSLQEEDEDWLRENGSRYQVISQLKRIDFRYCPSPQHLTLLLSLLTSATQRTSGDEGYNLPSPPGMIILWDVAGMLMEWVGVDENAQPGMDLDPSVSGLVDGVAQLDEEGRGGPGLGEGGSERCMCFKQDCNAAQYLDLIAAAKAAVSQLNDTQQSCHTQLVILEPSLNEFTTLPILPPDPPVLNPIQPDHEHMHAAPASPLVVDNPARAPKADTWRRKRVRLYDGLKWLFGGNALGTVKPCEPADAMGPVDPFAPTHDLRLASEPARAFWIRRRPCGRGKWTRPYEGDDTEGKEGDSGGWRWEWY